MDFAEGLLAITKRLENKGKKPFKVDFVYYNPEKKAWTLTIHQKAPEQKEAQE